MNFNPKTKMNHGDTKDTKRMGSKANITYHVFITAGNHGGPLGTMIKAASSRPSCLRSHSLSRN